MKCIAPAIKRTTWPQDYFLHKSVTRLQMQAITREILEKTPQQEQEQQQQQSHL